ncbi:hypothetical protein BDW71DRAFT_169018 [Aspergillus fruticulosus]
MRGHANQANQALRVESRQRTAADRRQKNARSFSFACSACPLAAYFLLLSPVLALISIAWLRMSRRLFTYDHYL